MRRHIAVAIGALLALACVANAVTLSDREICLVKVVLGQQLKMRLRLWQSSEAGREASDKHPFALALSNAKDKEKRLLTEFEALPERQRLAHAQALAYLGDKAGLDVLKKAAFPSGVMGPFMTSSGFEISESALCLLYLQSDFPESFQFSKVPNAMYPELDELLKSHNHTSDGIRQPADGSPKPSR
jgi:hypothetical protein